MEVDMVDDARRTVRRRRVAYGYYDPRRGTRYEGYGSYGPHGYQGAFSGLFRAATEAAAELLVGGSRVASTLLIEASDAMLGRRYVVEDFDEFEDEPLEPPPAHRTTGPAGPEVTERTEDAVEEHEDFVAYGPPGYGAPGYGPGYGPVCDSFNRAVQDSARVLSRSAERFASEYDYYGRWRPPVRVTRRTTTRTATTAETTQPAPTVQPGPAAGTATPVPTPDVKKQTPPP
jgi:hypothetical protein